MLTYSRAMSTMNISLPETLREFVDRQVGRTGYGTSSEYVRELIRRDQDRLELRALIIDGARSPIAGQADARYFAGLRRRIAVAKSKKPKPRTKPAG